MNRRAFIRYVAAHAGISQRRAEDAIAAVCSAIRVSLIDHERVTIYGLGTFSTFRQKPRIVWSVHQRKEVAAKTRIRIKFRASGFCRSRVERELL